jgi:hypothetical protein
VAAHVLDVADQKVTDRVITGLSGTAQDIQLEAGSADSAVLRYSTSASSSPYGFENYTVADLATAKVVTGTGMMGAYASQTAVSATHMALAGGLFMGDTSQSVRTMELDGDQKRWNLDLNQRQGSGLVGLVGGWTLYGEHRKLNEGSSANGSAFLATPIGGGAERKVMDHATSAAPAPDGSQLVMGGTAAEGEGLYRVSAGADGAPVAKLIAATGHPTKITLEESQVPAVAELDKGRWRPKWRLTHNNADVTVTLRHTVSGARREIEIPIDPSKWQSE